MLGTLAARLRSVVDAGLNLLYPPVCQLCEKERATAAEGYVGADCWAKVRFIMPPFCERCGLPFEGAITQSFTCGNCAEMTLHFRAARSAVRADDLILDVIHRYKYRRHLWFEPFLADLLIRQAAAVLRREQWDLIVPVQLFPVKEREREFNQAERLAVHLSRATGIPVNKSLVKRVKPTKTQTMLNREERAENVRNAFAPRRPLELTGAKVVLLDDVLTTGATGSACAKVLREAGAGDICVWTLARGT